MQSRLIEASEVYNYNFIKRDDNLCHKSANNKRSGGPIAFRYQQVVRITFEVAAVGNDGGEFLQLC